MSKRVFAFVVFLMLPIAAGFLGGPGAPQMLYAHGGAHDNDNDADAGPALPADQWCGMMGSFQQRTGLPGSFKSNGEKIYFTSHSDSNMPITYTWPLEAKPADLSCADCHGPDGRGGAVQLAHPVGAPSICWSDLMQGHGHAMTPDAIKRAVIMGLHFDGDELGKEMPRWKMSAGDLDTLVRYIMTLDQNQSSEKQQPMNMKM